MTQDVQKITGTPAKVAARLCNFETSQAYLQRAHIDFLDHEVAGVIRMMQGPWVDILGYASRRGDAAFNQGLSERRCNAVRDRISQYANTVNFQITKGLGESESGPNEQDNSGYWRAVEVYVYANRPPTPKPTPPVEAGSKEFKIRVAGGLSSAIPVLKGPQGDFYMFQIIDVQQRTMGFYLYGAVGLALPSLPGLPVSFTGVGPLSSFRTTEPVSLMDFEGRATLFQDPGLTIGPKSIEGTLRLSFDSAHLLRAHARVVPGIVPIEGGAGLQSPSTGSVSPGFLSLQGKIVPFRSLM